MLIVDVKGVFVVLFCGMCVDDVLCFYYVDVSIGYVEFDGSVIISGDVKDGMFVKVMGDIIVLGFVELVIIESKSEVIIMLGVIGCKCDNVDFFICNIIVECIIFVGYV